MLFRVSLVRLLVLKLTLGEGILVKLCLAHPCPACVSATGITCVSGTSRSVSGVPGVLECRAGCIQAQNKSLFVRHGIHSTVSFWEG